MPGTRRGLDHDARVLLSDVCPSTETVTSLPHRHTFDKGRIAAVATVINARPDDTAAVPV